MPHSKSLPESWDLPRVIRRRLGTQAGRQRIMVAEGHLLLVLHEVPRAGEEVRKGRYLWRNPAGEWSSTGLGTGPQALDAHIESYAKRIDELEDAEVRASGSEEYFELVRELAPVHRAALNLYETLEDARDKCPEAEELIDLRDRAYQVSRAAELLHGLAREGMEFETAFQAEQLAQHSHRMSVSAHRLNMLAAFFFPVMTLATIFGMNLKHGLEEDHWPIPFLGMLAGGLVLGAIIGVSVRVSPKGPAKRVRRAGSAAGTATR